MIYYYNRIISFKAEVLSSQYIYIVTIIDITYILKLTEQEFPFFVLLYTSTIIIITETVIITPAIIAITGISANSPVFPESGPLPYQN